MDIYVLNKDFESVSVIDAFESFIWTDRYNACGDFEIYSYMSMNMLDVAQRDYYLWIQESEHMMVIDERVITSDIEGGNKLKISGTSLEFLLDRRVIWKQTVLSGNLQEAIKQLLDENVMNPEIDDRTGTNLIFQESTDPRITELTVEAQFTGTSLYDAVKSLCEAENLGFKIILNDENQFVFSLYMGEDRSYAQEDNPYVVFSPEFDNVVNSNYLESNSALKNVALIAGEGEGADRKTAIVGEARGWDRREIFIDARDISSTVDNKTITDAEYTKQLEQRGLERLKEYIFVQTFEGEMETTRGFVYGRDFFVGDTVQIMNEYQIEASARIDEMIFAYDESGYTVVPTFTVITDDEETEGE